MHKTLLIVQNKIVINLIIFKSYVLDVFTDKFEDLVVDLSPKAIYARFLLHSMRDEEIEIFIKKCSSSMSLDDLLFLNIEQLKMRKEKKKQINIIETI